MGSARYLGITLFCGYFIYCGFTPTEWHFIDNVNLIFHEAGHVIFFFFGEFIQVFMGSGFQVLLPLFISLYFFYNRQFLSGALVLAWVGQSIVNVSVYAGDAMLMNLPLLGGDGVIHDWNYLLTTLGQLSHTSAIASVIYGIGMIVICMSPVLALYSIDK
jgi:hypothetical protein